MSGKDCDFLFKVVILGDSGVGKSALMLRFADDTFNDSFVSTIGVDYRFRTFQLDNYKVKLHLWDTAGQERYRALTSNYLKGAQGIIVVYDVTSLESLRNVKEWMQSVNKWANDDVARILVGNKADSVEQQIVAASEGEKLARELGMEFFQTSAKNGTNVDTVFMTLANTMLKIGEKKEKQREDMIKIQEATVAAERKKGCC